MNKSTKFTVTNDEIQSACDEAYKKTADKYKVQGFRPGKAPRKIVEQTYGEVFFEPALNRIFNDRYGKFLLDNPEIRPISDPDVSVASTKDGLELSVTIPIQEPFTLGKYKGLTVKFHEIKVNEKDVDGFLARVAMDRARKVAAKSGHKIAKGDLAVIDFVGSIDGKEFAGGKAANHELEIGSHSFIDNFEDQLVGKTVGDKLDIKVSFPRDYHAKELAGKPALFKTEIKNILIRELPAIDDQLAKESSEFSTLAEFKNDIRKRLTDEAASQNERRFEDALLQTVIDQTKVDVHPKLAEAQYDSVMGDLTDRLTQSGLTLELYAQYNGMSLDEFTKKQREFAASGAKTGLVLDAIGRAEKIKSFEEVIKFLKENNKKENN